MNDMIVLYDDSIQKEKKKKIVMGMPPLCYAALCAVQKRERLHAGYAMLCYETKNRKLSLYTPLHLT